MEKRAVSSVIAIIMIIALTVVMVFVVLTGIKTIINKKISSSESCSQIRDKVFLEELYTCYNSSSKEVYFSISVKDIQLNKISFLLENKQNSKSFEITSTPKICSGIRYFDGNYSNPIKIPDKYSGRVYALNLSLIGFSGLPDYISITPYINNNACPINLKNKLYDCVKMKPFV